MRTGVDVVEAPIEVDDVPLVVQLLAQPEPRAVQHAEAGAAEAVALRVGTRRRYGGVSGRAAVGGAAAAGDGRRAEQLPDVARVTGAEVRDRVADQQPARAGRQGCRAETQQDRGQGSGEPYTFGRLAL